MKDFTKEEKQWLEKLGKRVEGRDYPTYRINVSHVTMEIICNEEEYVTVAEQFLIKNVGHGITAELAVRDVLENHRALLEVMLENLKDAKDTILIPLISLEG